MQPNRPIARFLSVRGETKRRKRIIMQRVIGIAEQNREDVEKIPGLMDAITALKIEMNS